MKKYLFIKSYIITVVLILATGCSDSFLDTENPGKLAVSEFYLTDADAVQATTAVYDMMQSEYTWGFASVLMLKTMPSDESNAAGASPGDQPGYQTLDKFNFDSENDIILKVWRTIYYTINRANQVINRVAPETDLRKRLIAEAKALRAYNYFDLVALWGGVPLILNDLTPNEFTTQQRATVEQVYAQIEKDLIEAIELLPEKSTYSTGDKFRVSKGTARAILGKAYLYQGKWDEAAAQFDAIITSGEYELEENFGFVFSKNGEFGKESVMEVSYTDQTGSGRARESNQYIQLMGIKATHYTMAPGDSLAGGGWAFNSPKMKLFNVFVNAGDFERRKHTLMSVDELRAMGGDWNNPDYYDFEGVIRRKYGNYLTESSLNNGNSISSNYLTNWRYIRYADVLLMAAEAYYRATDEDRARTELNKVRDRAQMADITATGNELFEAIVVERQLELAFEGVRYPDLLRWGRAAQELAPLGFIAGKHELLPVPNDDVRSGGLAQNPNY
jgi:tetratricopeptide (TPR) repeat protein